MPLETHELYHRAVDAIGAKKVAHALSVSLKWAYRLTQPPMALDVDANGAGRNDFDRIEALVDVLSAHPQGRPVIVQMRGYCNAMFDRALGEWKPEALTLEKLSAETGDVLREFADFIGQCAPGELDPTRLSKEAGEAIAAIEKLMRSASSGMEKRKLEVR